jgi:hypothetical protein
MDEYLTPEIVAGVFARADDTLDDLIDAVKKTETQLARPVTAPEVGSFVLEYLNRNVPLATDTQLKAMERMRGVAAACLATAMLRLMHED